MFAPTFKLVWPDGKTEKTKLIATGKAGGAGEIFEIDHYPHHVAKIYHEETKPEQLKHYSQKIHWMVRNRPELPSLPPSVEHVVQLAWPVAEVYKGSAFVGFAMEKIDFERTIELDFLLTRRQAEQAGLTIDFGKLMAVAYNLSSIINTLHNKKIAVVDLKPMNIKVYKNELLISILDCDGFCIYADDFRSDAPQVTPEYLAPEFHAKVVDRPHNQDAFALATIIFRLLNYGIHPFVGISDVKLKYPTELAARIQHTLYAYGMKPHPGVRPVPASVHEAFPDSIRELFDRAFGWLPGARPGAYEWALITAQYANKSSGQMDVCVNGHVKFSEKQCPTCMREHILTHHHRNKSRLKAKLKAVPQKTIRHVHKTINRTHANPFQAALAQYQGPTINYSGNINLNRPNVSLATATVNALATEILWVIGMIITYWWLK
ncbi:MAG: DNA-binding protein [Betaproteobacteria bacterium]|nr:DNA-binding protein [Betaproteobacteria bacterium]